MGGTSAVCCNHSQAHLGDSHPPFGIRLDRSVRGGIWLSASTLPFSRQHRNRVWLHPDGFGVCRFDVLFSSPLFGFIGRRDEMHAVLFIALVTIST